MTDTSVTKCTECSSRDLDHDGAKGEVVCNECGTVLCEQEIDYQHPSTQVGENAHISSARNDSLGSRILDVLTLTHKKHVMLAKAT